ncbi:MAG: hypothetical protein IPN19_00235 [Elusimicrobia bacterium]|nr:hypothetical protein [Elusimicrobiota bacterium]
MKKNHIIVFSVLAFVTGGVAIFNLRNGAEIHQLPASFGECVAEDGIVDSHDRDVCRRTYRISSDPVLLNLCVEQRDFVSGLHAKALLVQALVETVDVNL